MKYLLLSALTLFAVESFGLQWTNCVSADGSLTREELELWGANPIIWKKDGKKIDVDRETFEGVASNGKVLNLLTTDERSNDAVKRIFHSKVILYYKQPTTGHFIVQAKAPVICGSYKDNRKDFAGPGGRHQHHLESNLGEFLK